MKLLTTIVATLGASFLSVAAQQSETPVNEASKPNIIFIFADDWGWGDVGAYGSDIYKTPHIDKLATEGTLFHHFTTSSGVCSPSRASIMTGHYPSRHSVHQHFATIPHHIKTGMPDWLSTKPEMLPRVLRAAGYATAHFGKWHLSNHEISDSPVPTEYGYDESAVFNGSGPQSNANPNIDEPLPTDYAIEFIKKNKEKPFFINLWVHATHTPHYPTEAWMEKFKHLDKQQQVYAAVVAECDERIGEVMATLDELKLTNQTVVIFSSDNGPENTKSKGGMMPDASTGPGLNTHYSVGTTGGLKGRKRSLFHGGIGVPFVVRWPEHVPAGKVDKTSILNGVDVFPTLCEIAGAELPEGYVSDGESVLAAFKGESFTRTKPIFWNWRGTKGGNNWPRYCVQEGSWTLYTDENFAKLELYNIAEDRAQEKNLADTQPEKAEQLKKLVVDWSKTIPTTPPADAISKLRKDMKKPATPKKAPKKKAKQKAGA